MILYMDTSALTKRYIQEQNSEQVIDWMKNADLIGSALITRVEMAATLTRAIKANRLSENDVTSALDEFREDFQNFQQVNIDMALISRADSLACQFALRGYDAVHLACALTWQDLLGASISLASFDTELCEAARKMGLEVLPA